MQEMDTAVFESLSAFMDVLFNSFFERMIDFCKRTSEGNDEEGLKIANVLIEKMLTNMRLLANVLEPPYDALVPKAIERLIKGRDLDLQLQYPGRN